MDRGGSESIGVMVSGWCPCVPLGRRESPDQQQSASSSRSFGNDGAPFTVSAASDHAEMVQMFYYENRGKCCKKLLRYNGYPNKVRNHPSPHHLITASSLSPVASLFIPLYAINARYQKPLANFFNGCLSVDNTRNFIRHRTLETIGWGKGGFEFRVVAASKVL